MAEAILRSFDKELEIYSAGLAPVNHISPVAIEVLQEIGIELKQSEPQHYSDYENTEFDFLITVGDGTSESLKIPDSIKFKRKMHLGFQNPYSHFKDRNELKEKCTEIRDEIYTELDYFNHRILKREKV
jgi:arsenate reductase